MSRRRPPPPDRVIGAAAAIATVPGWFTGMYVGAVYVIGRIPSGLRERDFMVAFGAVCVGSLSGSIAIWVREVQVAMSRLGVGKADIVRGILLGDLLLSAGALAVWGGTGFSALFMLIPPAGVGLGAWLAARRMWPFATARTPTLDQPAIMPK